MQYLEFESQFPHTGPIAGASGPEVLPAAFGLFPATLTSPPELKASSQDLFGYIKIPMIEPTKTLPWIPQIRIKVAGLV